ncbi:MAG: hypothetical protein ACOY3P_25385 [Planctomycetota bacterium]
MTLGVGLCVKRLCIALAATLFAAGAAAVAEDPAYVDFRPLWDTQRVLENPDKGWYHHVIDNGTWRYEIGDDAAFASFPGMDHLYVRLAWSYLEPEEKEYDWSKIDAVVNKYVPLGYGIAFRITCKERRGYPGGVGQVEDGVHYATPAWVRKAGAKGVEVVSRGGALSWCPDWDDPIFLRKLDSFHRTFAARYDGKPWVRYVDIGSIGDYGEGHTSASTKVPPTVDEVKAHVDLYLKHYKHAQLVAPDDLLKYDKDDRDVQSLYEYVVGKGITLRDDSPMVAWYVKTYMDTWTISHPQFYDPLYLQKPIIFELQHYGSVKDDGHWLGKNGANVIPSLGVSGAEVFRKAIETMHATYIGYHGYAEEFLQENPDLVGSLLNRCGYWYFPVCAQYPKSVRAGENRISITWLNKGVAPAYRAYSLVLGFESKKTGKLAEAVVPDAGNRNWLPGIEKKAPTPSGFPRTSQAGPTS